LRVRFAPSPTGYLHVGGARTALFNYLLARRFNGVYVLRIEDTDVARSDKTFEMNLIETLKWLGLHWDEGPDKGGSYGPYRQSERLRIYQEYAETLIKEGKAYRVYAYPKEIEALREKMINNGVAPHYNREMLEAFSTEKRRAEYKEKGLQPAVYFSMPRKQFFLKDMVKGEIVFSEGSVGDFVLLRSSGIPTYNFACVVDDTLMEITHVIRGDDHLSNTVKQLAIYEALGANPPQFGHVSTILGPDGKKLSKRHGSTSVEEYRSRGYLSEAVVNYLALLGWSSPDAKEIMSIDEMISKFSLDRFSKNPAIFDPKKLKWMNSHYIRAMKPGELLLRLKPYIEQCDYEVKHENLEGIIEVVKERMHVLTDFCEAAEIFFKKPSQLPDINSELISVFLNCADQLQKLQNWEKMNIIKVFKEVLKHYKVKGKEFYSTLRVLLTGKNEGPELADVVCLLGRDEVVSRIRAIRRGEQCSE